MTDHPRALLFVDLDGTVRKGYDELGRFVNTAADVEVFPEAVTQLRAWRDAGGLVLAVTNQAGVALGHMTMADHLAAATETVRQADGLIQKVFACTHHPDAGCFCRKPLPGMLIRAAAWSRSYGWAKPYRPSCLMVGDRPEDAEAAYHAGVRFMDAHTWRSGEVEGRSHVAAETPVAVSDAEIHARYTAKYPLSVDTSNDLAELAASVDVLRGLGLSVVAGQ